MCSTCWEVNGCAASPSPGASQRAQESLPCARFPMCRRPAVRGRIKQWGSALQISSHHLHSMCPNLLEPAFCSRSHFTGAEAALRFTSKVILEKYLCSLTVFHVQSCNQMLRDRACLSEPRVLDSLRVSHSPEKSPDSFILDEQPMPVAPC